MSICVTSEELEEAISHYCGLFGIDVVNRTDDGVELCGSNFTLWLEVGVGGRRVLQEWVTTDGDQARLAIQGSGSTILGDSKSGFYVTDPYGLSYHVFVDDDAET